MSYERVSLTSIYEIPVEDYREHRWAINMITARSADRAGIAAGYEPGECVSWMSDNSPKPQLRDWVRRVWGEQERKALEQSQLIIDGQVIDAAWVVQKAVESHARCERGEIEIDSNGDPVIEPLTGEVRRKRNEAGAQKAIEIVAKNTLTRANDTTVNVTASDGVSELFKLLGGTTTPPGERDK